MGLKVTLRWHFKPTDYFEETYRSDLNGIFFEIADGEIVAEVDAERYEADPGIRDQLRQHFDRLFEGVRLWSHKDFNISEGSIEKERLEGGKDVIVALKSASIVATAGSLDIKMRDADGNVVVDTRQQRIDAKREHADLIASTGGSDQTLGAMLESYSNAVKDPDDELIHLYEIREALVVRFGDERSAKGAIGVSSADWSTLGRLANDEPLNQGRHRGKQGSDLRDATADELEKARSIARDMIVRYARLLE